MFLFKIVKSTEKTLFNLNANFVVALLNGFVGATHIFVILAIKDNVLEITYQSILKTNYQNA